MPPPAIDALPRQAARDPDFWLLAVAVLTLFTTGIQLLIYPFGRSIAAHALLGRAILSGGVPVRDAWTTAAPGIGLLHAGVQLVLGHSMMAFRAVETIMLVSAVLAAARITKHWMGLERVGLLGGALFALTYVQLEIDNTGQPEFFAGVLLVIAVALCARETAPRSRWAVAILLGCLLGTLTIFVPSFALVALAFPRLFTRRIGAAPQSRARDWLQIGCMVLGFIVPLAAMTVWLSVVGASTIFARDYLSPLVHVWLSSSIVTLVARIFHLACGAVLNQSAFITAGLLATFTLGTLHEHERAGRRRLMSLALLVLVALALQTSDTPGALSAVLPLTTTVAGIGIYKTWRRIMQLGTAGTVAFWVTALFLVQMCVPVRYPPGSFFKRSRTRLLYLSGHAPYRSREMLESELYSSADYNLTSSRRVAASLRARSLTNRAVWVAGNEPQLAWMLEAVPQYRFLEPVPASWASATPELARRASNEANVLQPEVIVTSSSTAVSDATLRSTARSTEDYDLLEVTDNWRTYQRVQKRPRAEDDTEFCDPNL